MRTLPQEQTVHLPGDSPGALELGQGLGVSLGSTATGLSPGAKQAGGRALAAEGRAQLHYRLIKVSWALTARDQGVGSRP